VVILAKIGMENIIQSWSCFLPGQADKLDKYFKLVEEEFKKRKTGLKTDYEKVGALLGKKKTFLKIFYDNNNWCAYFGAEDLGTDLTVTWDLYAKNINKGAERIGLFKSDFIEINSIKSFASTTHDCAVEATEKLFDEGNLDKKNLNRRSSGDLGPI